MPRTDIKIISESQEGNSITTTVTDVNPSASAAVLIQFARKLNALTSNVYDSTQKIVTTKLDTEGGE